MCLCVCAAASTVTTHTSFITHPLWNMTGLDLTSQHALCLQQYVRNDRLRYLHTSLSSLGCSGLSLQKNTSKSQIIRWGFMQRQVFNCSPRHRFVTGETTTDDNSSGLTQSACSCLVLVTSKDFMSLLSALLTVYLTVIWADWQLAILRLMTCFTQLCGCNGAFLLLILLLSSTIVFNKVPLNWIEKLILN